MSRPRLTALLGPARSGKTAACINRLIADGASTRMLVPTDEDAVYVRSRAKDAGAPDAHRICTLATFASKIAGPSLDSTEPITPQVRTAALLDLLERDDTYFKGIRDTPGFVSALTDCVRELKLSAIDSARLETSVDKAASNLDDPAFADKALALARIFRGYEEFLRRHQLTDEEDIFRLASERAAREQVLDAKVILVDGFYRISPIWFGLLGNLARCGSEVTITLDFDPDRPLLFATTVRTLDSLRRDFDVREEILSGRSGDSDFDRLERGVFQGLAEKIEEPGDGSITLIDAPNVYSEVELVARALRREFERGTPASQCTVIVRRYGDYGPIIRSVFERFEIPVSVPQPAPLIDAPGVRALNALARVAAFNWRREDVALFLKSSAVKIDRIAVEILLRQMAHIGPTSGRDTWLNFAVPDTIAPTIARLKEWDDSVNAAQEPAIVLQTIAEEIGLYDDSAVKSAIEAIRSTARAARIVEKPCASFAEFWTMAESALEAAAPKPPRTQDSVWVLEAYDTRQRAARFTAVMGLIERGFPIRVIEDPFFRDDERAALRDVGLDLEDRRDRADDERLLFYRCLTEPSERLVLSYPRSSDDSDTLRSFYLDEVQAAAPVTEVFKELSDVAPKPEECVNEHDRHLMACAKLVDSAGDGPAITWSERLLAAVEPGNEILRVVAETANLPALPRLTDAEIRAELSRRRRYNVSELETYNSCPFQHLLKHILQIRPDEETAWLAERGSHYHEALRRQFRENSGEMPADDLRDALVARAQQLLDDTQREMPLHRRRLLERFLRQAFAEFAAREVTYRQKFGFTPAHFELAFGMPRDGERDYDRSSRAQPLEIESPDGSRIEVCGAMDRVDRGPNGTALIMDYKTGATPAYEQIKDGKSIQLPVYMMALEKIWDMNPVAACFDSAREPYRRRFFRSEHIKRFGLVEGLDPGPNVKPIGADEQAELYETAKGRILQAIRGMTTANILPSPGDHCRFCDYRDCCRTSRDYVHDGEPFDILKDTGVESG